MNADRRITVKVCLALIKECAATGEISDPSDVALTEALKSLVAAEHWQLKSQEKHAGKNASTDKQIAISRVALPALELAQASFNKGRFKTVVTQLNLALETDGTEPPKRRERK